MPQMPPPIDPSEAPQGPAFACPFTTAVAEVPPGPGTIQLPSAAGHQRAMAVLPGPCLGELCGLFVGPEDGGPSCGLSSLKEAALQMIADLEPDESEDAPEEETGEES